MMAEQATAARLDDLFEAEELTRPDIQVRGVTTHSGRVVEGGLFLACRGYQHHGLEYLDSALQAKPAVVAWEPSADFAAPELPSNVVGIRVDKLASRVGDIADRFYAQPSARLQVTGITGTNGKTTTAWLASHALSALGHPAAYMGTLGYGIGDQLRETQLTTPACITVHRRLRELVDQGAECVVMEVSSHGLDQGRIDGVRVQTAAFTNLSRDHLDYHGDIESYARAKAALFAAADLKNAVINIGDAHGARMADHLNANVNLISVSMRDAGDAAYLTGEVIDAGPAGIGLRLAGAYGEAELRSPMWGSFNAENLLVAAGVLVAHGCALSDAAAALATGLVPPGRMQVVHAEGRPTAIVDFAHTPDALAKALESARRHCHGALWLVFGCGGDRDRGKRAPMGAAASKFADRIVVTNDNPRHENAQQIVDDICAGMTNTDNVHVELDRRSAIDLALNQAAAGDVVLIAGKGSEDYQLVGDERIPFSDFTVATRNLRGVSP